MPISREANPDDRFNVEWGMGLRRATTFPLFGDGIFTQEGAPWKHSREVLRLHFQPRQYDDLDVFRESVDNLIDNIKGGGVIDLQPLFFRLTLDTTTAFLLGESVNSLKAPKTVGEQDFASAFITAQEYVAKRFRLLDLYWLIGGKKFQKACDNVHRFADQIIDRNIGRGSKDGESFLDSVAKNTPDRDALRGQIINILTAGRDTTACLLSWTL